ncbi:hypothetical protein [Sphingomonas lycopersici]|uniref:TonB-dependent receptor n=1 Tax=Sphingomonas lycopersici TaxID=2951807 RepID=A0AA41Z467_9SPHN|nr:hypothetical protein [Sphingomonas lycopersici]MCW6533230.1 hypothetical protein [Sphingomonas lycopersici]
MRALRALVTLPLLGVLCHPLHAGARIGADAEVPLETPASRSDETRDVVVTARRRGEAKVGAETEFDENQISARGADSIEDLLTRLAPVIGNGGGDPVILINGRPAGFDRSVLAYPAEALSRLEVLKPQASAVYAAPAGKRVVNLVLKPKFSSLTIDSGVNWATAGGQYGGNVAVGRVAIAGDTRWNVQARFGHDSALLKNARRISRPAGSFDGDGYVAGTDGGEIDPRLSDAAGKIVTVAAIPPQARSGIPAIGDFVATAGRTAPLDPNAFDTLQPSRRTIALDAGVTRPVGDFSVTLGISANSSKMEGLRGLPMAAFVIPAGSRWSPFAEDVLLTRPFDGTHALRTFNDAKSLSGSLTVTGAVSGWQATVALSYLHNWMDNLLESGVDLAKIRQSIDARDPRFNPYSPWDKSLLLATRSRSNGDTLSARLNLQKNIVNLPAGPLSWSLAADASQARTHARQSDNSGSAIAPTDVSFRQVNGQMSLNAPLLRRGGSTLPPLGDLSVNMWLGGQMMTRTSSQARLGGGMNWSPIQAAQFGAVYEYAGTAPSFDQLDAPLTRTVMRVFDYARQEVAEPIWITGGNPALQRGSRRTLTLSAMVQPLGQQLLMLNVNYRQTVAKGGNAGFPELSPAIEAAFPERVTRDAAGRLIAVDARAINIAHDTDSSLFSSIVVRFSGGGHRPAGEAAAAAANPLQFTVSLNHNWHLKSEMLIRPGIPIIDRLGGGTGASRHEVNIQFSAGLRGAGADFGVAWSSSTRINQGVDDANGAYRVTPPIVVSVSAFVDPDALFPGLKDNALAKGVKVSLSVSNLLNSYRRVRSADGGPLPGFSRDEVDPLGRVMQVTVRKRF